MTILRLMNLLFCLTAIFPIGGLTRFFLIERKEVHRKLSILNAILILMMVAMGLRAIIQALLYALLVFGVPLSSAILSGSSLSTNALLAFNSWLLWFYVETLNQRKE